MKKHLMLLKTILSIIAIIGAVIGIVIWKNSADIEYLDTCAGDYNAKPVIYLYPKECTQVKVKLECEGELTCTYPAYKDGWNVTANPDGTLLDADGKEYNYLYWESVSNANYDFSEGFCLAGKDTAYFLEKSLEQLGLTRREANEFIVYWLPLMQDNKYNLISFQTERYTESAKLMVDPAPDTLIRVFMAFKPLERECSVPEQKLQNISREGFTVVEWGGCKVQ